MRLLAQTRAVQIVVPGEDGHGELMTWCSVGGALVVVGLATLLVTRWRARGYDPGEAAFRKLARAAGLGRAERRAIRKLARGAGAAPAGLLINPSALVRLAGAREAAPNDV